MLQFPEYMTICGDERVLALKASGAIYEINKGDKFYPRLRAQDLIRTDWKTYTPAELQELAAQTRAALEPK